MVYNGDIKVGGVIMNCMKCGREVEEGQVFCQECLAQMETEPIRISTPVHIPRQPTKGAATHHAVLHPEEEIKRLEPPSPRLRQVKCVA